MINAFDNLSVYTVHCTWSTFDFIKPVILPVLALLKTVYFPLSTFDSEGGYLLLLLHCSCDIFQILAMKYLGMTMTVFQVTPSILHLSQKTAIYNC